MLDYSLLEALRAVEKEGSFERAAHSLRISPSAVSQRIKLLEERVGAVLINRRSPATATPQGTYLCRHVDAVMLLESTFLNNNQTLLKASQTDRVSIKVAVNDDSLSSWFMKVLKTNAERPQPFMLELSIEDQDYSIQQMRDGAVLAAITAEDKPVQGFRSQFLGTHLYRAVAHKDFIERYFSQGVTAAAIEHAPALHYSSEDDLQTQWLKQVFGTHIPHDHYVLPSSHGFVHACLNCLGWAVHPGLMVDEYIARGELTELVPGAVLEKPLYWHYSRLIADAIEPLTKMIVDAGKTSLQQ